MDTTTLALTVPGIGAVPLTVTTQGNGPAVLLLHGGGGPQTVTGFGARLAEQAGYRVLTPIHPGFAGTARPDGLTGIRGLAGMYAALLAELDLNDVTVIGNSIGGWIAAELGLLSPERIGRLVLVNAVGLQLEAHPIVDFFSLTMDQVAELSYADPDRFRIDVSSLTSAQQAVMASNRATLQVYGAAMSDPSLLERLPAMAVPTLVVWGAADRIVTPEHGRAYAAAIPGARFHLITEAGHLPQLETPDLLLEAVTQL